METAHRIRGCRETEGGLHAAVAPCCGFQRRFSTKTERREALKAHRTQLRNELTGVEERLERLGD